MQSDGSTDDQMKARERGRALKKSDGWREREESRARKTLEAGDDLRCIRS
jgi:hypothetical protein